MSNIRMVEIVPYDPEWPKLFIMEANLIIEALGDNCIRIHHIGSTAVPNLAAKPVIDMVPVVRDIMKVNKNNSNMERLGYEPKGEYGIPFRRYFQKSPTLRTHHAHVFQDGNPEIDRHLKFCNWLRLHPEDRDAYAQLKKKLAAQFPNDIDAYCHGKEAFITDIDSKAGYSGLRIVKALSVREWEAVRYFRHHYFFDKTPNLDPYLSTFENPDHVHFIFYKGTLIIGYVHIQFWAEKRAVLRAIVIEESWRSQGIGGQLLALCERWLWQQDIHVLQMESSPETKKFYARQGYCDMPFNDPENSKMIPQNISLGKFLKSALA